jgi:hypothetical protein
MFLLFEASLIAIFHFIYTSHHCKADSSSSSASSYSYSYLKFTELCALFLCENNIQHHKIRSFVIFFCPHLILFFILLCGWFWCSVQRIEYTNYGVRMTTQHKYSAFGFFSSFLLWYDEVNYFIFYAFLSTYAWVVG